MHLFRGSAELPLFGAPGEGEAASGTQLVEENGDVRWYRGWLSRADADRLIASIRQTAVWQQERRKMYDRFVDVPRLYAAFGDDRAASWTPELRAVRKRMEQLTGARFVYVLANRYRDGKDSVAWHSDREAALLRAPIIGSLTLGATRAFDLRRKSDPRRVLSLDLEHGDLLVMRGETQTYWEHRVRKDPRIRDERINLTFRQQPG